MTDRLHSCLTRVVRLLVGITVLVAAVGLAYVLVATVPPVLPEVSTRPPEAPVFSATRVSVRRVWSGYGTATAMDAADVSARVGGTVIHIPDDVVPGRRVVAGQTLVRLDGEDFERQVEIAEQSVAELRSALVLLDIEHAGLVERLALEEEDAALLRTEWRRVQKIQAGGASNPQEVDRVRRELIAAERRVVATVEAANRVEPSRQRLQAQLKSKEASLALAQQDLERTTIASPIDGVLNSVDVDLGEELLAGKRVARVVSLDRIEVPLRLPARARRDCSVGDSATLESVSGGGRRVAATVERIAPVDDPATRTVVVYLVVRQPNANAQWGDAAGAQALPPGVFVAGTVVSDETEDRWVVPRRSIRKGHVRMVRGGVVVSEPVTIDFVVERGFPGFGLADDHWAVLAGEPSFAAGELVLVSASQALRDGGAVTPVLPNGSEATGDLAARGGRRATGADSLPSPETQP